MGSGLQLAPLAPIPLDLSWGFVVLALHIVFSQSPRLVLVFVLRLLLFWSKAPGLVLWGQFPVCWFFSISLSFAGPTLGVMGIGRGIQERRFFTGAWTYRRERTIGREGKESGSGMGGLSQWWIGWGLAGWQVPWWGSQSARLKHLCWPQNENGSKTGNWGHHLFDHRGLEIHPVLLVSLHLVLNGPCTFFTVGTAQFCLFVFWCGSQNLTLNVSLKKDSASPNAKTPLKSSVFIWSFLPLSFVAVRVTRVALLCFVPKSCRAVHPSHFLLVLSWRWQNEQKK